VDWHGERHELPPVASDFRLPVDLLRDDRLDAGIAAFRRLAADGQVPDSHTEFYLNSLGYRLLAEERPDDAVAVLRLQADLYPTVPNVFDSLGDAYHRTGRPEDAIQAYRRAANLDRGFEHPRQMLQELRGDGG
jgi:tetratricopeptide (TPR) repeat protein